MSEMVERVAKAIRAVLLESWKGRDHDWEAIGHIAQQMYRCEARALCILAIITIVFGALWILGCAAGLPE